MNLKLNKKVVFGTLCLILSWIFYLLSIKFLVCSVVLAPSTCGDLSSVLRVAAKVALWPSLALGRMGLVHTWLALPLILVGGLFACQLLRERRLAAVVTSSCAYLVVGLVYIAYVPVPSPAYNRYHYSSIEEGENYLEAFEGVYRAGMINEWTPVDGNFTESIAHGLTEGYFGGGKEWESVMPGFSKLSYRPRSKREAESSH